jgi:hypothetical protein
MLKPAILFFVLALFVANAAVAQNQPPSSPAADPSANQMSTWRWLVNPFVQFSRAGGEPAGSARTATSSATAPALPSTTERRQTKVIQVSDVAVPPPPAPAAETPTGQPSAQTQQGPAFGPPVAPPYDAGRPWGLTVPPSGSAPESWPLQEGDGPEPARPGIATPGIATPGIATPGIATPGIATPGSGPPSIGPPGMATPGTPDPSSRRLRTSEPPAAPGTSAFMKDAVSTSAPLVFRTSDIVRPDLMRGANYRLGEYAPLVDFKFQFEIETPLGTIPAQGMAVLGLRLRELPSIDYAGRIAHKNPMFVEGGFQVAAKTPEGAYLLVTDPIDSVRRTAVGLKRIVQAKWSPGGDRANCDARRKLACLLSCDPESRNPVLQCLLDDMSANASAGWLAADVAVNFGVPGIGALAANAEFKQMMAMKSTREIQTDLDASLIALGVPDATRMGFLASTSYTTTQRMAFVYYLRKLVGIDNVASLVEAAADTINESEALASIQELQLLAELRRTHPITRVTFVGLPIVFLADGSQIIATSADYLVEAPRITQMITRFRTDFPSTSAMLLTLGRVSAGAARQFAAAGISVARHRFGDDDANAKAEKAAQLALLLPASDRIPSQNASQPGREHSALQR